MKFSIAEKVNILTTGIIFLASVSLGLYFVSHERKALNSELDERSYLLLNSLNSAIEYPILIKDKDSILRVLKSALSQKEVVGCKVVDKDGKVFREVRGDTEGPVREFEKDIIIKKSAKLSDESMIFGGQKISEEFMGRSYITVSLASLKQKERDVLKAVAMVVFVGTIFASMVSYIFLKIILNEPIAMLVEGTENIAKGYLDYEVHIKSDDEVGQLACAFNAMVGELKKSRNELEGHSRNLELKVKERTNDLQQAYDKLRSTEEQLIQSAKMASLGTLAGGVAHEINNPLTGILGYAQILLSVIKKDNPYRQDLVQIENAAVRCKRIIDNLLRFSRQQKFSFEFIDLNQAVEDTLVLIGNQLHRSNIRIYKDLSPDIPTITGNAQQLQQVFLNIITNAYDAMPEGGDMYISTEKKDGYVVACFRDTGRGIAPEIIDKVFDPFVTTKPPGKGTGLGLSVSYGIIQNHKGEIKVESRVGEGTTFITMLPIISVKDERVVQEEAGAEERIEI